jgi:hypothetical protein
MPRKKKPADQRRIKLNLTIHPEIREWADSISGRRRRSISHVFEELVEAEWQRFQALGHVAQPGVPPQSIPQAPIPAMPQQQPYFYPPQPHYIAQQQGQPQQ